MTGGTPALGPFDYPCFDFVLRSDLPLPELSGGGRSRLNGDVVTIREGDFPNAVTLADAVAPELQVEGDRTVLTIPGVARYQICRGTDICINPAPDASPSMIRLFLLGSALGILSLQRGLFLLHANAVVIAGSAFAFAGPSGAGKSTLAGHFQQAGHPVLCDDVCAVSFEGGAPVAWPGLPRLKLWRDAAEALGHDPAAYDRVAEGHEKYQIPYARPELSSPVPLVALYILDRAGEDEPIAIDRLTGVAAMAATMENSYRPGYLRPLGLSSRHFRQCSELLAHAKMYQVRRRWGFDVFGEEVAQIERHAFALSGKE